LNLRFKKSEELFGLIVVLFFIFGFHAWFVTNQDLRFDELITTNMIITMSFQESLQYLFKLDSPQIIYYIYLYLFKEMFGLGLWSLRGASVLLSFLCLIDFYRLNREFLSSKMSLVSVLMLGISFPFLLYGSEVRPYAMLLLLSVMLNRYYVLMWRERSSFDFYKYTVIMALMVATHLSGFLLLAVHALDTILNKRTQIWQEFKKPQLLFAAIVVLPMIYQAIRIFNHRHDYRTTPTVLDFLNQFVFLFNGKYFVIMAFSLIACSLWWKFQKRKMSFLVLGTLVPIVLLFFKSIMSAPAFEARYVLYSLPLFLILVVHSIGLLSKNVLIKSGFVASLLFILGWNCFVHEKFHQRPYRIDSRGASALVIEIYSQKNKASVVSCGACLHFYLFHKVADHQCNQFGPESSGEIIYIEYKDNKQSCVTLLNELTQNREVLQVTDYQQFQIFELGQRR
jgi:hypothetical protein